MSIFFTIERRENGLAYGYVTWKDCSLRSYAVSGPYGNGELPEGLYHIKRSGLMDRSSNEISYCDSLQNCWFQYIEPQFSTSRNELGIHPDGNLEGTLGCIGLLDSDTRLWKEAFESLSLGIIVTLQVQSINYLEIDT